MKPSHLHRTVLIRLFAAWIVLSIALGAVVFYLEMGKVDALMLDLATSESRALTEHMLPEDLNHLEALKNKARDLLQTGFISVRIYDNAQRKVLEIATAREDEPGLQIKEHVHPLAADDLSHYHTHWIGGEPFMQVLQPIIRAETPLGFFEGVYKVSPQAESDIKSRIAGALTLTVVVILVTSIALYPLIVLLNRGLVALSSALLKSNIELMETLGSAIAKRDSDTDLHNYRVTIYAIRLAQALGCANADIRRLIAGAFLHDVGKIGISDNILLKPGPLTQAEMQIMRKHVLIGLDIIARANWLKGARDVVEFHHERFDGSGYLHGIKGETIPLNARIFALVDVFDALVSRRPYKEPLALDQARAILREGRGTDFDPRILDVLDPLLPALYSEIADQDERVVRAMLRTLVARYWKLSGNPT